MVPNKLWTLSLSLVTCVPENEARVVSLFTVNAVGDS